MFNLFKKNKEYEFMQAPKIEIKDYFVENVIKIANCLDCVEDIKLLDKIVTFIIEREKIHILKRNEEWENSLKKFPTFSSPRKAGEIPKEYL